MTTFTLLVFLMFGMSSSVLAMEASDPSQEGKVHWQAEDRLQVDADDCVDHRGNQLKGGLQGTVTQVIPLAAMMVKFDNCKMTIIEYSEYAKLSKLEADQQSARHSPATSVGCFQPSLDDTVSSRALGSAVVSVVADKLDSAGFAALLGSSGALATILRHTPAYGAHVQAKQRQRRWCDDLAREMERAMGRARVPGVGLVVDIEIGQPRCPTMNWTYRSPRAFLPAPHNRLSLAWDRHVPKGSWGTCRRRAQGEQETYTTQETWTTVISEEHFGVHIETHNPSDPSVTVSRSTLVEALFNTFNQYGTPKLTLNPPKSWRLKDDMPLFLLTIAVATDVDEVKAQQLMNKLVDRLTKKQIFH